MRLPQFDISEPDKLCLPSGLAIFQLKNAVKKHVRNNHSAEYLKTLDALSVMHFKEGWNQIFGTAPPLDVRSFQDVRDAVCKIHNEWNDVQDGIWEIGYLGSIRFPLVPPIYLKFDMSGWQSELGSDFVYWCGRLETAVESPDLEHIGLLISSHMMLDETKAQHMRHWDKNFGGLMFSFLEDGPTTIAPPPYAPSWVDIAMLRYSRTRNVPFEHVYAKKE